MNNDCLTCKRHYTQGGKCCENKRNCLLYKKEPRGRMIRTNIIFDIDVRNPSSSFIKYGEKVLIEEDGKTFEMFCIKLNWLNLRTRECSISVDYHENEKPKFERMKMFKIIK